MLPSLLYTFELLLLCILLVLQAMLFVVLQSGLFVRMIAVITPVPSGKHFILTATTRCHNIHAHGSAAAFLVCRTQRIRHAWHLRVQGWPFGGLRYVYHQGSQSKNAILHGSRCRGFCGVRFSCMVCSLTHSAALAISRSRENLFLEVKSCKAPRRF